MSRVVTIKDEWTKTAADLLLQHEYRVTSPEWVPYCTCGWSAEDYCDVAAYDEHVARVVLEAVTPLIVEQALRDAADELEAVLGDSGPGNRTTGYGRAGLDLLAQLRARADRIEGEATSE